MLIISKLQMHKQSNTAPDFDDIRYSKLTKFNCGKTWFTSLDKALNIFLTKILNLQKQLLSSLWQRRCAKPLTDDVPSMKFKHIIRIFVAVSHSFTPCTGTKLIVN
jgi:hypothetical protein